MKIGKIILGAAAFMVTSAAIVGFKLKQQMTGHHRVYGSVQGFCTASTCSTAHGIISGQPDTCLTIHNQALIVATNNGCMFAERTAGGTCTKPTIKWTHLK